MKCIYQILDNVSKISTFFFTPYKVILNLLIRPAEGFKRLSLLRFDFISDSVREDYYYLLRVLCTLIVCALFFHNGKMLLEYYEIRMYSYLYLLYVINKIIIYIQKILIIIVKLGTS